MEPIETYVFMDLETTGLPIYELNKTKITELSMVAVCREHILDSNPQQSPRVKHKLTLCFNPGRLITPESTRITGLSNFSLESLSYFNANAFQAINGFLSVLKKPVCLLAHNGNKFDFPIFKNHLEKLGCQLSNDIMCGDTYIGFYNILKNIDVDDVSAAKVCKTENVPESCSKINNDYEIIEKKVEIHSETRSEQNEQLEMKLRNEMTPKSSTMIKTQKQAQHARKRLHFDIKPQQSYKLESIYERLLHRKPYNAHQAECDCLMMIDIAVVLNKEFVNWVDKNCSSFLDVKPMALATPLGK